MTSIYEQALGSQFQMLHPKIRERFGFDSKDHIASIGEGVMEEIWYAPWVHCLYIGTMRHIMFPNRGKGSRSGFDELCFSWLSDIRGGERRHLHSIGAEIL